ncbi:ABC-2 type transport system ATP-binding protein [Dethiosulfatibacter aminovorans DSM 17477]|uniref:ABC-2 type transport system ATP-binding protein n=1 Tax=Dethiosulfatibacter aminovorans DSM 17477 TaxID=1121476 RepID=A0A1M6JFA7_9FIRM|nr:ABC transporter ATP-binding protein [Dethiosulfatibacter aminovorans]SHJ45315.1 ABC-2 type transport system ATP-binding protein [Dethiosulfatibacter aminovorans DSM 17477]
MEIELRGIKKRYKNEEILKGLEMKIDSGEFAGIIGPNGTGKTTVLNIICGLLKADSGSATIGGRPAVLMKEKMGYVPQEIALYGDLSVTANMKFFAGLYELDRHYASSMSEEILNTLGLYGARNKKVRSLSGGMKRRLNIGTELLKNPEVLILDEPAAGVDIKGISELSSILKELSGKGMTIVMASHQMRFVEELCTSLYFLSDGRIELHGRTEELLSKEGERVMLEELYYSIFKG